MSRPAVGQEFLIEKMIIHPAREPLAAILSTPRPFIGTQILREASWIFGKEAEVPPDGGSWKRLIYVENICARQDGTHESSMLRRRQDHAPIDWRPIPRSEFDQVLEYDRRGAEPV
jgi:hypothetical protein